MAQKTQAEIDAITQQLLAELPDEFMRGDQGVQMVHPGLPNYCIFHAGANMKSKGCLMRIAECKRKTVADWLGYTGWDMPESKKTQLQKECEKTILPRPVLSLRKTTAQDLILLESFKTDPKEAKHFKVDVSKLNTYEEEHGKKSK